MKVYVATITDFRYEQMAVASTAQAAREAVFARGVQYLNEMGTSAPEDEWNTVEKMDEYYGITVTEVEVDGPGVIFGNN